MKRKGFQVSHRENGRKWGNPFPTLEDAKDAIRKTEHLNKEFCVEEDGISFIITALYTDKVVCRYESGKFINLQPMTI